MTKIKGTGLADMGTLWVAVGFYWYGKCMA